MKSVNLICSQRELELLRKYSEYNEQCIDAYMSKAIEESNSIDYCKRWDMEDKDKEPFTVIIELDDNLYNKALTVCGDADGISEYILDVTFEHLAIDYMIFDHMSKNTNGKEVYIELDAFMDGLRGKE